MSDCRIQCLKLKNISVKVGDSVLLSEVNLHAHSGELTAIIGRNGAGKSTLLKAILGQVKHTGSVVYNDGRGTPVKQPRIGYVPQRLDIESGSPTTAYDLLAALTTNYPLFLPRRLKTVKILTEHLASFNAANLIDKSLGQLSGGELQRVLLAAATLPKPDMLIMDEPVSGMDSAGLKLFYDIISRLKSGSDMIIILVSHDLDFVRKNADHILLLDCGVATVGNPDNVFKSETFMQMFPEIESFTAKGEQI